MKRWIKHLPMCLFVCAFIDQLSSEMSHRAEAIKQFECKTKNPQEKNRTKLSTSKKEREREIEMEIEVK